MFHVGATICPPPPPQCFSYCRIDHSSNKLKVLAMLVTQADSSLTGHIKSDIGPSKEVASKDEENDDVILAIKEKESEVRLAFADCELDGLKSELRNALRQLKIRQEQIEILEGNLKSKDHTIGNVKLKNDLLMADAQQLKQKIANNITRYSSQDDDDTSKTQKSSGLDTFTRDVGREFFAEGNRETVYYPKPCTASSSTLSSPSNTFDSLEDSSSIYLTDSSFPKPNSIGLHICLGSKEIGNCKPNRRNIKPRWGGNEGKFFCSDDYLCRHYSGRQCEPEFEKDNICLEPRICDDIRIGFIEKDESWFGSDEESMVSIESSRWADF